MSDLNFFMFCDEVVINVAAGDGGDGCVSYCREKYRPKGGPDGGDGGRGGNVVLVGDPNLNSLYDYSAKKDYKAEAGVRGSGNKRTGRTGQDLVMNFPLGTKIYDNGTGQLLADITNVNANTVLFEGGRGGKGNANFTSSVRQLPTFAELGEKMDFHELRIELELIADIGIIGMPSAGKSTLVSVMTDAKPKIGDYPFTTLIPNLGVVSMKRFGGKLQETFVLADIPGLIAGASQGKGLGFTFLKHIRRTSIIVHLIDVLQDDFVDSYEIINNELRAYDEFFFDLKHFVVFNKIDGLDDELLELKRAEFLSRNPHLQGKIYFVSAVSKVGIRELAWDLYSEVVDNNKKILEKMSQIELEYKVFKPHLEDERVNSVEVVGKRKMLDQFTNEKYVATIFEIKGVRLEQIVNMTNFDNEEAINRVYDVLKKMNLNKVLLKNGAKSGDIVRIGKKEIFFRG